MQSTSRDITGAALIRLDRAGYTTRIRLPIHDEVLFSFPKAEVREQAAEAGQIIHRTIRGKPIPTDHELAGRSWASVYESDTKH